MGGVTTTRRSSARTVRQRMGGLAALEVDMGGEMATTWQIVRKLSEFSTGLTRFDLSREVDGSDDDIDAALDLLESVRVVIWTGSLCWQLAPTFHKRTLTEEDVCIALAGESR